MKKNKYLCISVFLLICTSTLVAQVDIRIRQKSALNSPNVSGSTIINLPSNAEHYNSLRLSSLGDGLNGIVSDDITDYFRNPAFVYMVEKRTYFLDFDMKGSSNDLRISMFSSFLSGRVGISFSGDAVENSVTGNSSDPELDLFDDTEYSISKFSKSSFSTYNLHLWWANKLSEKLKYGLNYIRKSSLSVNNRTNMTSRLINRTDTFSQLTTVNNRVDFLINDNEKDVNINTFRGGFIFGSSPDMVVDMVLKAEFTDIDTDALSDRKSLRTYSYDRPDYFSLTEYADTISNVFNSNGNSYVYGLDLNIKKKLNESVVQSYLLSFDRLKFDVSEKMMEKEIRMTSQIRDSIFSISKKLFISDQLSDRKDATAYVFKVGLGSEIKLDKALVGIGISAIKSNGSWKTNSSGVSTGLIEESTNDTSYQQSSSADLTSITTTKITSTLISFPIGGEFNVSEKVSLRMGVEFKAVFNKNKLSSSSGSVLSNFENHSYGNIKRFGIGYKHSDKFLADLMANSDLARISSWRISIQYGL